MIPGKKSLLWCKPIVWFCSQFTYTQEDLSEIKTSWFGHVSRHFESGI